MSYGSDDYWNGPPEDEPQLVGTSDKPVLSKGAERAAVVLCLATLVVVGLTILGAVELVRWIV